MVLTPLLDELMDRTRARTRGRPGLLTWSPLYSSAAVWFDGADGGTITDAGGGKVSQWDDKSGNGRHATQGVDANRPLTGVASVNGENVMEFGGAAWFDFDLDWLDLDGNHYCFVVTENDNNVNIYGAATPGQGDQSLHVGFNGGKFRINRWGNDTGPAFQPEFSDKDWNQLEFSWPVGSQATTWQNGTPSPLTGPNKSVLSTQAGGGRLCNVVNQGIYDGRIAEFVLLNYIPADALKIQFRDYFTAKWGAMPV